MKIEIKNIGKKYEGNREYTLIDLNAKINSGDFTVLLGPSGSGKTTLLRMIAGLNSITRGDLLFDGNRVNELAPKNRDIAMVFQSYALYPHMTVYENMAFGMKMAKIGKTEIGRRVTDVAKILDISKYLYSKPSDLSGGQRQRVALGRAICRKPSIFLMDEPLSNLDAKLREKMRVELVRIHNMLNTTTIYVTHDQLEAMTMATKILLINDQEIVQTGSPDEIFSKPNCIFAAKFIGTPSMNLIEGEMVGEKFISKNGLLKINPSKRDIELIKRHKVKNLLLGIRAGDITLLSKKTTNSMTVLQVDVVENLGAQKLLTFRLDKKIDIAVLVDTKTFAKLDANKKMYLSTAESSLHFFDSKTTQRICDEYDGLVEKWTRHQKFLKNSSSFSKRESRIKKFFKRKEIKDNE